MPAHLLSVAEAAQALNVSPRTVRRMIQGSELPAIKVRAQTRVLESDLDAYIAGQRRAGVRR